MLTKLLIALVLMALCVGLHAMGLTMALQWLRKSGHRPAGRFWPATWLLICVATWTVLIHLVEIALWAFFYTWKQGMPDLPSAFYFSAVTYTTTGYGDLVLPPEWRLVGGVEALTGILMCGWFTGFFFAVVSRMYEPPGGNTIPDAAQPPPARGATSSNRRRALLLDLLAVAGTGCSGLHASKSVSPLDFILPGLIQYVPAVPSPSASKPRPELVLAGHDLLSLQTRPKTSL